MYAGNDLDISKRYTYFTVNLYACQQKQSDKSDMYF